MPDQSKNSASPPPEAQLPTQSTRRSFAKSIAITIGAVLAGSLITLREWYRSRSAPAVVIAHTDEIPVGATKIFQYPTDVAPCILVRTGESSYVAYSRICTHNSCPVFYRPDESAFECRCHGGLFSVTDGSVLAGPPPRPLPRIRLAVRGKDILAVGITST
jgi:nitrite reductase/ring-hydroxylating ferredoxin subunit